MCYYDIFEILDTYKYVNSSSNLINDIFSK